jgi:hypothetical protein
MTDEPTGADGSLLAALDNALSTARSTPPDFVATAKACFAWHNIDAELARLTHDSSLETGVPATARSEQALIRAMRFEAPGLTIELELGEDTLQGQLVPRQPGDVEMHLANGEKASTTADEFGYFTFGRVPVTSFRLHCRTANDVVVTTTWVVL